MDSNLLNVGIGDRPQTIQLDQLVRNTARLHSKLSDIVDNISYCYSLQVKLLQRFQFSNIYNCNQLSLSIYSQFMLFSLKVFIFVLSSLFDVYLYFLSRRPHRMDGAYCLYMASYAMYYAYFLARIALNGTYINIEVSRLKVFTMYFMKWLISLLIFVWKSRKTAFIVNKAMDKSQKDRIVLAEVNNNIILMNYSHLIPYQLFF